LTSYNESGKTFEDLLVSQANNNVFVVFGDMKVEYTIDFNTYESKKVSKKKIKEEPQTDGPVVERKCPKCGNNKMSYATLQLRSADEGQTVFFTCTKCKFKESENS
jgi:DNA-directed RNA polymerase I subunit RPA12